MKKPKASRRLVIDASVAQAAGLTAHPVSRASREFLSAVLTECDQLVMTSEIAAEWRQHRSTFSLVWRSSMTARKKVVWVKDPVSEEVRDAIIAFSFTEKERTEVEHDLHLIEAALRAERIVVSGDNLVRKLFCRLSREIGILKSVVWVNPSEDRARLSDWLQHKISARREWRLISKT